MYTNKSLNNSSYQQGLQAYNNEQFQDAINHFKQAQKQGCNITELNLYLILSLIALATEKYESEQFNNVITLLSEAEALFSTSRHSIDYKYYFTHLLFVKGLALMNVNDMDMAVQCFENVIQHSECTDEKHVLQSNYYIGKILTDANQFATAIPYFEKSTKSDQLNLNFILDYSNALYQTNDKVRAAEVLYKAILEESFLHQPPINQLEVKCKLVHFIFETEEDTVRTITKEKLDDFLNLLIKQITQLCDSGQSIGIETKELLNEHKLYIQKCLVKFYYYDSHDYQSVTELIREIRNSNGHELDEVLEYIANDSIQLSGSMVPDTD